MPAKESKDFESLDDFKKSIKSHAIKIGCNVNEEIFKNLKEMKEQFGKFYCPCRSIENIDEKKRAIFICPCVFHEKEIKMKGSCHCNLFIKK